MGLRKLLNPHKLWASALGLLLVANTVWTAKRYPWMLPLSLLLLVWLSGLWMLFKKRGAGVYLPKFLLPLGLFFIYSSVSFVTSTAPLTSVDEFMLLCGAFLAMLFASETLHDQDSQDAFLFFTGLCLLVVSLHGLVQHFLTLPQNYQRIIAGEQNNPALVEFGAYFHSGRAYSFFVYPNALASFLILCLPPWVAWQWSRGHQGILGKTHKFMSVLMLVLGGACLIFTYSIGGWFSLLLAVFLVIYLEGHFKGKNIWALAGLIVVVLAFLLAARGWQSWRDASVGLRLENWKSIMNIVFDSPAWGKGLGSFAREYMRVKSFSATEMQYAHNTYLHWFAELGLIGFVLFFWFLYAWFQFAKQRFDQGKLTLAQKALFMSLIAFWIHAGIDLNAQLWEMCLPAWLFMGMFTSDPTAERVSSRLPGWLRAVVILLVMLGALPLLGLPFLNQWHRAKGMELALDNDLEAAQAELNQAVRFDPWDVRTHDDLAGVNFKLWQDRGKEEYYAVAEANLNEAVSSDPENAYYHEHLAMLLLSRKEPEKAYGEMALALQYNPTGLDYWQQSADTAYKLAYIDRMNDLIDSAAKYDSIQPLVTVGDVFYKEGGKDLAVKAWQKALEKSPNDPLVLQRLQLAQQPEGKK